MRQRKPRTKRLIVSLETTSNPYDLGRVVRKGGENHLVFNKRFDFNQFFRSLPILETIATHKPRSIYELGLQTRTDFSNLNRTLKVLDTSGVIDLRESDSDGRQALEPRVKFDEIVFRLLPVP